MAEAEDRGVLRDGILLSVGTLTSMQVGMPSTVDPRRGGLAMVLAPLAIAPLAVVAAFVAWFGYSSVVMDPHVVGILVVATLAIGTRALHVDGLADMADGLTSGHDPERSLEVMKRGSTGPAGAAAIVLTLGLQVAGIAALQLLNSAWLLIIVVICASRAALTVTCSTLVPPARAGGLAMNFARTVPVAAAAAIWVAMAAAMCAACVVADLPWWRGLVTIGLGLVSALVVTLRARKRFGGVTGDVFGAAIEVSLAVMLASLATSTEYSVEL